MTRAPAYAKINLALVVGPRRADGKHEVATVLQRVDLHDEVVIEPSVEPGVVVEGFAEDTLVRTALGALTEASGSPGGWHVRIEKRIPLAAGLGGGSSDAAASLSLANGLLSSPLTSSELHATAARVGSDVPFFLTEGTQLGTADGSDLTPIELPLGYTVLLVLPDGESKRSTAEVYRRFDERRGHEGFALRRTTLGDAVARTEGIRDLVALPHNDLASSPFVEKLEALGAFRADVTGAGPTVYGLFADRETADRAAESLAGAGRIWVVEPVTRP